MSAKSDRVTATSQRDSVSVDRTDAEARRGTSSTGWGVLLREQAHESLDHLTGALLPGPGFLAFERELATAARTSQPLSVGVVAVDVLTATNDVDNHPVNDQMLTQVMATLVTTLRSHDLIIRYSNHEFLCVLSDLGASDADARCDVLRSVMNTGPATLVRVGVDQLRSEDSAEDLIARAATHSAAQEISSEALQHRSGHQ
ncbi:MAG: GGDEF domain-containing protein [Nocardioides sp.]